MVLQIIILRKDFKIKNLLQVFVGIVFGYFTTFSNYLFSFLPDVDNMIIRIALMLGSAVFIAVEIFFYLLADIVPLAGEGAMQAITENSNIAFNKVKIGFDVSMVSVSLISCIVVLKAFGSVGMGTVVAAVLVGTVLGAVTKAFGAKRDYLLEAERR